MAASFGARFVEEWIRVAGTRACFRYKLIQDLRRADRERTIVLLRRGISLEYRWIARIRDSEAPEDVAREMWEALQAGRSQASFLFWPWPLSL
jgi:hypothetical protein